MRVGEFGGRDHALEFLIAAAVRDIGANGIVEKKRALRHETDFRAERLEPQLAQVDSVDGDAPLLNVIEARDQIRHRGLAAATHPDQSHHLARADLEVDIVQHPLVAVSEADVFERDAVRAGLQLDTVGSVGNLARQIHHLEDALSRSEPLLNAVVGFAQRFERPVHENHRREKSGKLTKCAGARLQRSHRPPDHGHDRNRAERFDQRSRERLDPRHPHEDSEQPLELAIETCALVIFHSERLHDAVSLKGFMQQRLQAAQLLLLILGFTANFFREARDRQNDDRETDERDNREPPIDPEGCHQQCD